MTARSRKPVDKSERNTAQQLQSEIPEKRDLFTSLGLGQTRSWMIGAVAALTSATLILNGDGLTLEGDNILIALLWSLLAAGLLFVRGFSKRCRSEIGNPPCWFDVVAVIFFGWVFVSFVVVWCSGNGVPRAMLTMLAHWTGFAAMFVTWRLLLNDRRMIRGMFLLFVALIIAETSAAYYHYCYVGPQTRREYYAQREQSLASNENVQTPGEQELLKNRVDSIEPLGTYSLTNSLAAVLAPWCVFLCCVALLGRRLCSRSEIGNSPVVVVMAVQFGMMLLMIVFVGYILLMTNSRSGILATLFGIASLFGYMIVAKMRNKRALFGTALAGCVVIATGLGIGLATGGLDRAILSTATKSFGYRIQYWQSSSQMIADHPFFGCGIGNFREHYTLYKLPTASETIADPHNLFFEIATNAGLPALICFVVLLIAAFGYAFSAKQEEPPPASNDVRTSWKAYQPYLIGGFVGIIAAFVYSYTNCAPMSFDMTCFVLIGFLFGFFLFVPIIDSVVVPLKMLAPICLAVLTVALLASGGISFPHVNVTFWFLMALCLNRSTNRGLKSPALLLFLAVCFLALVIVLYPTAWLANLQANTLLRNMEANPSQFMFINKKIAEWEKVVKIDPYRTRVWSDLCAAYLLEQREFPGMAQKRPNTSGWQAILEKRRQKTGIVRDLSRVTLDGTTADALAHAIQSSPLSATNYQSLGMAFLDDFKKTKNHGSLDLAIVLFELAAARYPNHTLSYAYLGICYQLSDETELQLENAKRAIELDDIMPHTDQKLPSELRQLVEQAIHPAF